MSEREFIVNSFRKNFTEFANRKIVIYGISENTKFILHEFPDFNIMGLMDGYQDSGHIYGKKILSCDEVTALGIDAIVIIARAASVRIIYSRIAEFCKDRQIALYDVNGCDLLKKYNLPMGDNDYFNVSEARLKEEIASHEVISFDVFDTLIMRRVLYPTDVFHLVAQKITRQLSKIIDFVPERIAAERELLAGPYPNIDMIYDNLKKNTGLSENEINYLKALELDIEKNVAVPRVKMKQIFEYALSLNKKVYLVSDMYLKKEYLSEILQSLGIDGYRDLLVSCDYGTTKTQNLFAELKKTAHGNTYLHIGDNYEADILSAGFHDIHSFRVFSARQMLAISYYKEVLNCDDTFSQRILLGLFIEKIFNNPFALYMSGGKAEVDNYYDMGYLFIAPMIAEYLYWLVAKIQDKNYTKIIFFARDGYLLQKLYAILAETASMNNRLPQGIYFLTSRVACIVSAINSEDDIERALAIGFDGCPELLLRNRFALDAKDISAWDGSVNIKDYVLLHKEKIYAAAKNLNKMYLQYAQNSGIRADDKIAVFDLAASGTCQMFIEKLLRQKLDGYYFIHIKDENRDKLKLNIESLFQIDTWFNKDAFICESYIILESLITSFDPYFLKFSENGTPIFAAEHRNNGQMQRIAETQKAITQYFKNYMYLQDAWSLSSGLADKLLSFIQKRYTAFNNISLTGDELKDEFFNRSYSFSDILE